MSEGCKAFLDDPEGHAEHLASCEECRALDRQLETLDREIVSGGIEPPASMADAVAGRLPVAAWEGASYRSWRLVVAVGVMLFAAAAGLFFLAGISPADALRSVFDSSVPRVDLVGTGRSLAQLLREAPVGFHILIGILFIAVNAILILLLRRAPRGYDASR